MSTKEMAYNILESLTEEQLKAFITLFNKIALDYPTVKPDELDIAMIEDSKEDNETSMPLDEFVKELGFNPNDLRI